MALAPGIEWEALKVVIRGDSFGKSYGIRKKLERELMQQEDLLATLQSHVGSREVEEAGHREAHRRIEAIWNRQDSYVCKDFRQWLYREGDRSGDRSGRMLAQLFKRKCPSPIILSPRGLTGQRILGQARVNLLLQDHLKTYTPHHSARIGAECVGTWMGSDFPDLLRLRLRSWREMYWWQSYRKP
ncbi:hypothetical protein NDU88_006657 [Pleurodeles waltl]|uniref:Uncharacterized protein n=1 Tax=Pleurodeles waltl TaxID=8319 RepID=A0AAV7N992_PLEWA|nr:hypothetical protein NDU88_006657 [Pleurodeles waltl]